MERSTTLLFLKILNAVAFLGTITVNALANALPINGKTTGELSDLYPNLFVPAGFTFSIWGVIYLLLAIFVVYQFIPQNRHADELLRRVSIYFILTSGANIGWIFLWHHERVSLSLVAMLVLLASLVAIYLRVGTDVVNANWRDRLLVQLPFSMYLGWITVATIANVTAVLVHLQWNRFGATETLWTVIVLIIAALITIAVLFTRNDLFYGLVILWAFFGILYKRLVFDSVPNRAIIFTLFAVMAAVGVVLLLRIPFWFRGRA